MHDRCLRGATLEYEGNDDVGLRVGRALAERLTRDKPRMPESIDVIKWACKDLWGEVFRKQVLLRSCLFACKPARLFQN